MINQSVGREELCKRLSIKDFVYGFRQNVVNKIKVRVFHNVIITWSAIKSVCEAFEKDDRVDLVVIGISDPQKAPTIKQIVDAGFNCIAYDDYDAAEDKPDIFIVNHLFERGSIIKDLRKNAKFIVVTLSSLQRDFDTLQQFFRQQEATFGSYSPDYYFYDNYLYEDISRAGLNSSKMLKMSSAKYDEIYYAMTKKNSNEMYGKLKGKKVILYTTDHGVTYDSVNECTFDLYFKKIIEYSRCNEDIGIIFRPHPTLISELVKYNFWGIEELNNFTIWCNKTSNIIFDRSVSPSYAYSVADGIIVDAICGMVISGLAAQKPMCVVYRCKEQKARFEDLMPGYYQAYDEEDIFSFMNMIKKGEDILKEEREEIFKKYISLDGKNGERIKNKILELYLQGKSDDE